LIIPAIVDKLTESNYLEIFRQLCIEPFVNEIKNREITGKEVLLTVVVKDSQLLDVDYTNELLNVISSYVEITGIYLVPYCKKSTKRIKEINFIINIMKFIKALKDNQMYVHVAYCDIEGLLYSLADIDSVSIGTYENLRDFNLINFDKKDGKGQKSPNKRVYSNKLFQWIDLNYLGALKTFNDFNDLFEQNKYITFSVPNVKNWHFRYPELYKHYMMSIYNQYKSLPNNYCQRYKYIKDELLNAIELNKKINDFGILFDTDNDGSHLERWITALNLFDAFLNEK